MKVNNKRNESYVLNDKKMVCFSLKTYFEDLFAKKAQKYDFKCETNR